ncbi:outer membrane protein transport protein [bacterium]|nr:outer membrane protein transport protein [bacterium]MCB2202211.1 outer membrane protein transport protein [bacterium]
MMRSLVRSAILVIAFAATGFTQISYNFTGAGARAKAMGGAFIGVSDDITAGTWNPAGLWVHEGPKFGADYGLLLPRGESETALLTASQSGSWNSFGALAFVAPIRIRGHQFVASASYSTIFEDYSSASAVKEGMYQIPGVMLDPAAYSIQVSQEAHFDPRALVFALGTRLSEKVSFGFSTDIYLGKATVKSTRLAIAQDFPDGDSPQTAVATQRGLGYDTTSYSGFGLTGGLKYNGDNFALGLIVRAPFSFKATTDSKGFTLTSFAGLDQPDNSDTIYVDDQLVKYDLPIMVGVGFAYNLKENLLWAIDAEYRPFSGHDAEVRISQNLSEDTETFQTVKTNWEDVFTFRTGMEYQWETGHSTFPLVPLRLGFAYVPVPTPDQTVTNAQTFATSFSSTSGYSITGGFGLWWEYITLDVVYSYSALDRESFFILGEPTQLFVPLTAVPVEVRDRNHNLSLTFTGYF